MGIKLILAAASDWRSLIWLGAGIAAAAVLSNPFPAVVGLGLYLWVIQRLVATPQLQQAADRQKVAEELAARYKELQQTARAITTKLPNIPAQGEPRSYQARATQVLTAARSVYQDWLGRPDADPNRAQWVAEALQLAAHYLRILQAYHGSQTGQRPIQAELAAVRERLAANQRRLEQTQDLEARRLLMQAIELDERVVRQGGDAGAERERYQAKLAAIESTLDMLRRRIFEPDTAEPGIQLHDMLLEAEAMDEALQEVQHRTRVRVR